MSVMADALDDFLSALWNPFLLIWIAASSLLLVMAIAGAVAAISRWHRASGAVRAATALGCLLVAGAVSLHHPVVIHCAQQARAAEMSAYLYRPLAEFEARFGPPARVDGPFLYWRTLPWSSPLRWGSVMLMLQSDGTIGYCHVRGARAAFT
jgi:hypothetical protein